MPSVSNLTPAGRGIFASGIAELNQAVLGQFGHVRPDLDLVVISEFQPAAGEWIAWHVHRPFEQNLEFVQTALGGRKIEAAAVAYDSRSALEALRRAASVLASDVLTTYDEDMNA